MEKERVKQLMTQADATLDLASEERMKPEEDVVHYSICHNSRLSIRMYLISYLLKHQVQPDKNESIMDLLKRCAEIDDRFSKVDISEVECRSSSANNNVEYCLSLGKVSSCFDAASKIKNLIYDLD